MLDRALKAATWAVLLFFLFIFLVGGLKQLGVAVFVVLVVGGVLARRYKWLRVPVRFRRNK